MVGGAVRNALLNIPIGDIDIATTALPDGSDPPRQGGRHQERADRHRPRHRDAGRRCASVRGHHAARGYRDLRPQGQGGVRPRLGCRCRAARLHHQRPVGRRRRRRARSRRRALPISPPGACASSATPTSGSPRIICASSGFSAFTPPSARASPIAPAISPASAPEPALPTCPRNGCAWKWSSWWSPKARPARSRRWRMAGCCCRFSAASPIPGRLQR